MDTIHDEERAEEILANLLKKLDSDIHTFSENGNSDFLMLVFSQLVLNVYARFLNTVCVNVDVAFQEKAFKHYSNILFSDMQAIILEPAIDSSKQVDSRINTGGVDPSLLVPGTQVVH